MSDKNSFSTYEEVLKGLVSRIPYVLAAFVTVFLVIVAGLIVSIGYVPMKQRLFYGCLVGAACLGTFILTLIYLNKIVKYIIDTGNAGLLDSQG